MFSIPEIKPEKASIEITTACNHSCVYCPVSKFPQKQKIMSLNLFEYVMKELKSLNYHLRRISFTHYNEPLLDPFLKERIKIAMNYSFFNIVVIFTNLSVMKESLIQDLQFAQRRLVFSVNLPTANKERYFRLHGADHYPIVEENIRKLVRAGFEVKINVQKNVFTRPEDQESVIERFENLASVDIIPSDSRAGLVLKRARSVPKGVLAGCFIKRPINHVHIGIDGEVFLCCQDFFKKYKYGSLKEMRLKKILNSEAVKKYLGFIYGGKGVFPRNFICRSCEFAIYKNA